MYKDHEKCTFSADAEIKTVVFLNVRLSKSSLATHTHEGLWCVFISVPVVRDDFALLSFKHNHRSRVSGSAEGGNFSWSSIVW